jgi:hypothetical protein
MKGYQTRMNLEEDENGGQFAESHKCFEQVVELLLPVSECT